ncbi:lysoplasmalogenase [Paenibacillus larvae]|nr:lysoplasmalogenase [Paenibacillus larvae]MCY7519711.1 lysoplasmalogenase [Paenibacillus larvae]MCY9502413.1 lysoplasmalogenase [Paenibacillus larvae]MCY9681365.1 lysoplasmalogenase [Paenibacillus larvae]MCY9747017.1 lysoplasmalogenase [Paenibacillus larvae]MCY9751111.1 lysoplasmalogenase [Paenibacillus larvae]
MTFSFIGDLSMAGFLPWRHNLIGGMLSFGIAHVCYLASFAGIAGTKGIAIMNSALIAGAVLLVVTQTWIWRTILRVPTHPRAVVNGAFAYGLLVGSTAVAAAGLWQATAGYWWLPLAGGLLFVLSDFFIGWSDIGGRRMNNPHLWIWVTYGLAQACIVYSPLIHDL